MVVTDTTIVQAFTWTDIVFLLLVFFGVLWNNDYFGYELENIKFIQRISASRHPSSCFIINFKTKKAYYHEKATTTD